MSITSSLKIQNLLIAFLQQIQDIEDMLVDLAWNSRLEVATGSVDSDGNYLGTLDKLGEIAGEPRLLRSDAAYRYGIKLRRILNRASGTPEEMLSAIKSVSSPSNPRVTEYGTASCQLFTDANHTFTADELLNIRRIAPAGVKVNIVQQINEPFVFKEVGEADPAYGLGFSSDPALSDGGYLAELL